MRRASARWTIGWLVVGSVAGVGCSLTEPSEPTPDPAWSVIRVYTTGGERMPESVSWQLESPESPAEGGVVSWIPEGTCIFMGRQWTLRVSTQDVGDKPIIDAVATSRQFSGESPLDLAIERTADGRVVVTEGIPDWWNGDGPIGCASG